MTPRDPQDLKDELVFTGERFIPNQTDPLLALEHYHRYYFASRFARQKRVLDCACGEGYGSAFLSDFAQSVVGIDIDGAAVEHARKKYAASRNLTFETGSCDNTPAQGTFDMAVSFELIEHLDPNMQARFLENIGRVLKPEGLFLISSPEKNEYSEIHQASNEYHKHEMTLPELTEFLSKYFKYIHLCAQRVLTLSAMWQLSDWRNSPFRFHARTGLQEEVPVGDNFSQPLYIIALCSNAPFRESIPDEINSFYLDKASSDQSRHFAQWARKLNEEIQRNRETIAKLQLEIAERNSWAANLDSQIRERDASIDTLQKELESRTAWIRSLEQQFEDRTTWALSLEAEVREIRRIRQQTAASLLYRVLAKMRMLPRV